MVLVPSEAPEEAQIFRDLLFGVQAKAVLDGAEPFGRGDLRRNNQAVKILSYRFAVVAHVCVIHVAQHAHRSLPFGIEKRSE